MGEHGGTDGHQTTFIELVTSGPSTAGRKGKQRRRVMGKANFPERGVRESIV